MGAMWTRVGKAALLGFALAAGALSHAAGAPDGAALYQYWCGPCHSPGRGHPGTESLQVKYQGKVPAVLLERSDLSPQAIAVFVRQGVLSMPPFRKTEISDADLEALAAYLAPKSP